MSSVIEVAVVGSGPYGLSIAAHLQASGVPFRIFGRSFSTWREQMPEGMLLKSDGFASNLSDPTGEMTLERYCREQGLPYDHTRIPVPLSTFVAYGSAFQNRLVPNVDPRQVVDLRRDGDRYHLRLEDGEIVEARRVVLAVGITHFAKVPPEFAHLPRELATHSSQHRDLQRFRGKRVVVLGGGASAIDIAALLREAGAEIALVARRAAIAFNKGPKDGSRSWWERLRRPSSGLGSSWSSRFFCSAPHLFRRLPASLRVRTVKRYLGPAPGWPMRERVAGIPTFLGSHEIRAEATPEGVMIRFVGSAGPKEILADHLILATGYKADVNKLTLLDPALREDLRTVDTSPALSAYFESSVPGLYFVGLAAANTFGPLLRFAYGADFTARRLSAHLIRVALRTPARGRVAEPFTEPQSERQTA